jgi:hypothetical protein
MTRRPDLFDAVLDHRRRSFDSGGTDADRLARAAQLAVGRQLARGKLAVDEARDILAMLGILRRVPADGGEHDCR